MTIPLSLTLWGIPKKQTHGPCLIKLKASRGRGCVSPASDKEKTSQCWTGVEITDAVRKGRGRGRLDQLAKSFKEKVRLIRI